MAVYGLLLGLLITLLATSVAAVDEIHGCGGFVEASSGLVKWRKDSKLDYSDITVELCTIDGLVKERTHCAPNGYYFIPVYDKGSFVVRVKGPEGWSWDPEKVPVTIDQNGCNGNADINFKFTGFMIWGKVLGAVGGDSCNLKNRGPKEVKVELLSPSGELISHVFTSDSGEYSFPNVIPGNYKLCASHPDYEIEAKGSSEVNLGFGNMKVENIFLVSGYNIYGSVVAQGNPILGVNVYLYSSDVSEVHCPQNYDNAPKSGALCSVISDADGKFVFRSIPCGTYELVPYYKGENTVFDVSPPSLSVSVGHNHLTIPQKFQVTGFSVGGRVVDGKGEGIEKARVIVDGQIRAITDNLGYYKLDQVTSKRYSIVAEKDHYKFNPLENFLVLPNIAYIDDIKAIYYDICGSVRMITPNSKAMVALTHGPENVKPQKKLVNESGRFCFEVPAGEYRVSALAVDSESSSSLVFSPSFLDVKIEGPVLNLEFSQSQVNVYGKVVCKEKCSGDISLSLVRLTGGLAHEKKTIQLGNDESDFVFEKVFPGKYNLEIKHGEDSWCWDQNSMDLNVGTEDLKDLIFTQKGYWTELVSTHDTDAFIVQPDSSKFDLSIKRGSQRICIENPGRHELHSINSCIHFGSSSLDFDTRNPMPIHLSAKKYLVKGEIQMEDSIMEQNGGDLSGEIPVDTFGKDGNFIKTIATKLSSGTAVYEYSIWADLGEEITFVPRDSSSTRKKKILFYPSECKFTVAVSGCQDTVQAFNARPGLYMEGSVFPALSGVSVRIVANGKSSFTNLDKGDVAIETETDSDGFFFAGPLYDDITYNIEASKMGYHIRQTGDTSFTCQKLGQIVVKIHWETESESESFEFPSVLLSLSGENGYRNNSISGTGGTFSFDSLFPGSFYLRPLLKEYSFSPRALAIDLESGESRVVEFHATRVAFSAMGTVTLLTGQPKEGVIVEARSESKGFYEEATTDTSGKFRLRGLIPDATYLVRIVPKSKDGLFQPIERASPDSVPINVGSGDIKDVNFVVFETPEIMILSGHVEGGEELETIRDHLSVEVRSVKDPARVESVISLPISNFFEIRDLPKGRHLVQLRSRLPYSTHTFNSEIYEIDLERNPQLHIGPIKYKMAERHHKQEVTPAPVLPLIVGVSVIVLFISMPRLKDLYQAAVGMSPLASNSAPIKKDPVRKAMMRKRA